MVIDLAMPTTVAVRQLGTQTEFTNLKRGHPMEIRHECTLIHFALECKATYQIPTDSLNPMRTAIATIQYCLLADCSILSWSGPIGLPATHLLAEDKYGT